jgi:hypothetical protein
MSLCIHYHPKTGQIIGWENTDTPYKQAGFEVVSISLSSDDGWEPPDPKRKRIDVVTKQVVDLTAAEITAAAAPTMLDLQGVIVNELSGSDAMLVPDRVVANRDDWIAYRQALRDLSKGDPRPTPTQMLAGFPLRPDGSDAATRLRARL